jgi:hypothetical protein
LAQIALQFVDGGGLRILPFHDPASFFGAFSALQIRHTVHLLADVVLFAGHLFDPVERALRLLAQGPLLVPFEPASCFRKLIQGALPIGRIA